LSTASATENYLFGCGHGDSTWQSQKKKQQTSTFSAGTANVTASTYQLKNATKEIK